MAWGAHPGWRHFAQADLAAARDAFAATLAEDPGDAESLDGLGRSLRTWITGITSDPIVFMLIVIGLLLPVGMFVEPLPAPFILAPFLAPVAEGFYGIDPVQFAVVMVMSLVLGLIHPPVGLVLFLVSSISKVSFERLSLTMIPWLAVSLVMLILVALLPAEMIFRLAHWTS